MDGKTHDQKLRVARIESLRSTQAWEELKSELEKQEEKYWTRHRADVAQGKYPDALSLARAMGKLDGIRAILRAPEKAATIMERLESEEEAS
jgi:uncharacterized iron-regulated protein